MSDRSNVVLLIADDHRFGAIRACGDPPTPPPIVPATATSTR